MGPLFIILGLTLFCFGVILFFKTMLFSAAFYVLTFSGLISTLLGAYFIKRAKQDIIRQQTQERIDHIIGARNIQTKRCPSCSGEIESSQKRCPICGYRFEVIQILTVFAPFETTKHEALIKYLMTRTGKGYKEIAVELEKGMVFRYATIREANKNRMSFEGLGCKVKADEILLD